MSCNQQDNGHGDCLSTLHCGSYVWPLLFPVFSSESLLVSEGCHTLTGANRNSKGLQLPEFSCLEDSLQEVLLHPGCPRCRLSFIQTLYLSLDHLCPPSSVCFSPFLGVSIHHWYPVLCHAELQEGKLYLIQSDAEPYWHEARRVSEPPSQVLISSFLSPSAAVIGTSWTVSSHFSLGSRHYW